MIITGDRDRIIFKEMKTLKDLKEAINYAADCFEKDGLDPEIMFMDWSSAFGSEMKIVHNAPCSNTITIQ